jgi:hypothetical protein
MANYNETTVAGSTWTRCSSVYISNVYESVPSITFGEQQLIVLENQTPLVVNTNNSCSALFDPNGIITVLDPATGSPTGQTVTQQQLYDILYSLYIATAAERDAQIASQTPI